MNVLIVHAHHEPHSFCSALAKQAQKTLIELNHSVTFLDLYGIRFDPVSDRRNFTTVKDPSYLKQANEEEYATHHLGFCPDLESHIQKLEGADLLIFSFPLWWFGMPGILKGWVDKVFASERIYGGEKIYEHGLGQSQKRAMVLMTTGGGPEVYGGFGINPSLSAIMTPIQHGVFWFNGFLPLDPMVAWSPARISLEERQAYLAKLDQRLRHLEGETPQIMPGMSDFPGWSKDIKKRYMVTISQIKPSDEAYDKLVPQEIERVAELKKAGVILSSYIGNPATPPWHAYLVIRESSTEAVQAHLKTLPLAPYLDFTLIELLAM